MKEKEPTADYKLVRFFDWTVKAGKQYQYRLRVWLSDPNNSNPDGFDALGDEEEGGRNTPQAGNLGLGGGEGGGGQEEEEETYKYVPVTTQMLDPIVRDRLRNQPDPESLPKKGLMYSRTTDEWTYAADSGTVLADDQKLSEAEAGVIVINEKDPGQFYAGRVLAGKVFKSPDGRGLIQAGDPAVDMVASQWDKRFDTQIPVHRVVQRGEVMNFRPEKKLHLLHPVDLTVRVLEEPPKIETDAMVVDIVGGEKLPVYRAKMDFYMPGEVLILDGNGTFRVQNDIRDRKGYFQSLFLEDELAEVGKARPKENAFDEFGGRGPGDGDR